MPSLPPWLVAETTNGGNIESNILPIIPRNLSSYATRHGVHLSSFSLNVRDSSGGLGSYNAVNSSLVLNSGQQRALQSVAFASSAISLIAALLAIYWFCMMRRSFRRDLILLLIAGGSWKSLWFVIFGAVEFSYGSVPSSGAFCQASGYMLEVGFEACDFAVLSMSLHMLLQIFPPAQSILANDGLYRIRYWIFALWIILPNLAASLAFINPLDAYTSVGGFCFLPVRPFWYRLALFWIPRYLIWLFIMYVVIRIYRHVGKEFEVFGQEKDDSASVETRRRSSLRRAAGNDEESQEQTQQRRPTMMTDSTIMEEEKTTSDQDLASDDNPGPKVVRANGPASQFVSPSTLPQPPAVWRYSLPSWAGRTQMSLDTSTPSIPSRSLPTSRRGSRQVTAAGILSEDFAPPPSSRNVSTVAPADWTPVLPSLSDSPTSPTTPIRAAGASNTPPENSSTAPLNNSNNNNSQISASSSAIHRRVADNAMQARRRAIQRQLRLLFIYPIVYMLLWIMPSIVHFMNYSDHFAQHPVFALSVIQTFCLTIMTTVDVVIFCWRERPWRHVPGSNGTVWGSLCWWKVVKRVEWSEGRRESRAPAVLPPAAANGRNRSVTGGDAKGDESRTRKFSSFTAKPWRPAQWKERSDGYDEKSKRRHRSPRKDSALRPATPTVGAASIPVDGTATAQRTSRPARHSASLQQQQQQQQQRKRFSAGSDRRQMETDRAYERLALERAENAARKREMAERRVRGVDAGARGGAAKEWFDREMLESFEDGDDEDDDDDHMDDENDDGDDENDGGGIAERRRGSQGEDVHDQPLEGEKAARNDDGVG